MAYYNYKRVRDAIPKDFYEEYERKWKQDNDQDFECSCDYDGDLWCMAAAYIEHLHKQIDALTSPGAGGGK
jgi:hypothetical protein